MVGKVFAVIVALITLATAYGVVAHAWWMPAGISVRAPNVGGRVEETTAIAGLLFVAGLASIAFLYVGKNRQKKQVPGRATLTHTTPSKLHDYYTLTKPEVNLLILMTTSAGYFFACPGPLNLVGLANTLVGTLLVASGTATLNQWMERVWDGQMRRTASRPLPSGRMSAREALLLGISLSLAGGLYLAIAVNRFAAVLAISTLLSYLLIYTPLKRKTPLCTLLGAFPGAMPTLIGWAGASPVIDGHAWFLFALVFLWQFPHFLAIAILYREDYARAGYKMLPDFDADGRFTRAEIAGLSLILVGATLFMGLRAGPVCLAALSVAGAILLYPVMRLVTTNSRVSARQVVHASVLYLPMILLVAATSKL